MTGPGGSALTIYDQYNFSVQGPDEMALASVTFSATGPATIEQSGPTADISWSEPGTHDVTATMGSTTFTETVTVEDLRTTWSGATTCTVGTGYEMHITGTHPDSHYAIFGSDDLLNWSVVDALVDPGDLTEVWTDCEVDPSAKSQFYRVELAPPAPPNSYTCECECKKGTTRIGTDTYTIQAYNRGSAF